MKRITMTIMSVAAASMVFSGATPACTFLCDANIRDAYGNIVGTGSEGDYVEVQGYDEDGRVIVYDYTTGACGTVVAGALDEEYYWEPESYYDDYDYYYEENDVNYYSYEENNNEDEYYSYNEENDINYYSYNEENDVNYYSYNEENDVNYYDSADVGNTWVDIDLSTQIISVYSEDNQILASCCVTGMAGIMDTPAGVWSILNKQRNATLVGDDYECPVDYWMPFTESGCGIHDATWRDDFSPDAYLYNGSHGCVNVGYDTAANIYDLVDCGTSVIVHY